MGKVSRFAGAVTIKKTLKAFDQAIQLDPAYMKAYFGMGNSFFKLWRYEEALAAYEQASKLNPKFAFAYSQMTFYLRTTALRRSPCSL